MDLNRGVTSLPKAGDQGRPHQISSDDQLLTFPRLAREARLRPNDLALIAQSLRNIIGQPRIFPLYELSNNNKTFEMDSKTRSTRPMLTRPVAARIMNVASVSVDELQITLQPCVLSTSTAIMSHDKSIAANRYIWRISLSE